MAGKKKNMQKNKIIPKERDERGNKQRIKANNFPLRGIFSFYKPGNREGEMIYQKGNRVILLSNLNPCNI